MINKVIFSIVSASITLIFQLGNVNAGELYNQYNHDVHILAAEQWKNPKKLIKISDEAGALLRPVLDIERFNLVNKEINTEEDCLEKLVGLSGTLSPILSKYDAAFIMNKKRYEYEAEYLAAFKIIYKISSEVSRKKTIFPKTTDQSFVKQDESLKQLILRLEESRIQMNLQFLETLASKLSKQIDEGRFSELGSLEASELLATIKKDKVLEKEKLHTK